MEHETAFEKNTIILLDEEGQEHEFEIIDILEEDEREYLAIIPVFDQPQDSLEDSGELVILRAAMEEDEDGDRYLEAIEDEEEYNRVAQAFMKRLEDEFEFEEEDK